MGTFVKVAKAADVPTDAGRLVEVAGKQIALFQVEGKFYALDDTCTHAGGPLSDGTITGLQVQCPWHGANFHLETGQPASPPAFSPVGCYPVRQQGDDIEIEV